VAGLWITEKHGPLPEEPVRQQVPGVHRGHRLVAQVARQAERLDQSLTGLPVPLGQLRDVLVEAHPRRFPRG
jgi:hypothetical protein